jgi:5'-phosphate synthase pdxT subunit
MAVGVLALQGDVREHLHALAAIDELARPVRTAAQLEAVDALIIPGGESTTIINLLHAFELTDRLTERLAGGMPVWGTCAGMIVLAQEVLDPRPEPLRLLDISVRRNAYGRQVASFEAHLDVEELGAPPFCGVFIRAPAVERVGPGVQVLAALPDGRPVAVRRGSMLATSFHPELTGDLRFHRYFCAFRRDCERPASRAAQGGRAPQTPSGFRERPAESRLR